MKKTTKPTKSPAPATATAVAPAPAPKPSRIPRIKEAASSAFNGASTPAPAAPSARPTIITAKVDIGFGNQLFLRGEGPGLSWDKGIALDCVADDRWVVSLPGAKSAVVFKFLLNDETWSTGDDFTADPGASLSVTPLF